MYYLNLSVYKTLICILFWLLLWPLCFRAQDWNLRLSSRVEKEGKALPGAVIRLYQGSKLVNQLMSGSDGDFEIDVPPNGDFMLQVSYGDCNAKKFQISTRGVPEEITADRFRPSFEIGGVTMAKPLYSIDYSLLDQPLVKVAYMEADRKFDHDERHTEQMLQGLSRIREAEKALIRKQQETCKAGDEALKKKDCELAKQQYEQAISMLPQEPYDQYPKEQLKKVNDCFGKKQEEEKKKSEEEAAKAGAAKAAAEKAENERLAKEKAEADRRAADQAAKEQAEKEKQAKSKEERANANAEATVKKEKENQVRQETLTEKTNVPLEEKKEEKPGTGKSSQSSKDATVSKKTENPVAPQPSGGPAKAPETKVPEKNSPPPAQNKSEEAPKTRETSGKPEQKINAATSETKKPKRKRTGKARSKIRVKL